MTTKERPILFSAPMVRAILDGRKTQTRRVCKQADFSKGMLPGGLWAKSVHPARENGWIAWDGLHADRPEMAEQTKQLYQNGFPCPYGKPGDRLWVRETWNCIDTGRLTQRQDWVRYRATDGDELRWRPSIFMPRWASRITLEVVSVRVERVQEITEADVKAEGVMIAPGQMWRPLGSKEPHQPYTACQAFGALWDNINDKRGHSWESNPWVWCVSFRRLDANV